MVPLLFFCSFSITFLAFFYSNHLTIHSPNHVSRLDQKNTYQYHDTITNFTITITVTITNFTITITITISSIINSNFE